MSTIQTGSIIKMSGLSVKKENGVFEVGNTWEKDFSCYKLKKDGTRIKHGLDIFSYKKFEQYGKIITLDQVPAAIKEINKQLKERKENEVVISFESTDKKEYSNKTYIKVIEPIHTTKSIYAISRNSIFQLSVNEKWDSVTWQRVGKRGELLSNYDGSNMMNWSNKNMVRLFEEGYIEIVERVETARKEIEQNEVSEEVVTTPVIETIEEVKTEETTEKVIEETPQPLENNQTNNNEITFQTGTGLKGNGIEITFTSKPSEEVRNLMKANGYRWGGKNRSSVWWAFMNEETLSIAEQLTQGKENNTPIEEVTYPEINIDDCSEYTVSQELQNREHDANWIFRKNKKDHNKELQEMFISYTENVKEVTSKLDNEYYIYKIKSALQSFKKNYHSAYINWLSAKASQPHWAVSGRGNLNKSRYDKALSRQDKWMSELVSLPNEFDNKLNYYANKDKKDKENLLKEQLKKELSQPLPDLSFKTITKELDIYGNGNKVKTRIYECEGYFTCKTWGAWRVYDTKTGKEVYSTKSNGTLQDAKAYISLMIKQKAS